MRQESITYRRSVLYDQVWAEPVRTVAKRYGVSDVALAKTCRKLAIPLPGVGYWAKHAVGKAPRRKPLPSAPPGVPEELTVTTWRPDPDAPPNPRPVVLECVAREKRPEAKIKVGATLEEPHRLVAEAARILGREKPHHNGRLHSFSRRCLDIDVSPPLLDRALRIMDAFVWACESRGLRVEVTDVARYDERGERIQTGVPPNATRVLVDEEWIHMRVSEAWTSTRAPMPRPPRRLHGEDLDSWMRDHRPPTKRVLSGNLQIEISDGDWCWYGGRRSRWRDARTRKIEDVLNQVVAKMRLLAIAIKEKRAEDERRRREDEAKEVRRREEERRQEEERRRVEALLERLKRWRLARDIRAYVAEAQALLAGTEGQAGYAGLERRLAWALGHADEVDPLSDRRQEFAERSARAATPSTPGGDTTADDGG